MSEQGSGTFSHLVVVESSAGGIEALSTLISTLPEGFAAPIVVQHSSPGHESHLAEILTRRGALPVKTVTDHATLVPGTVYVVPSDRHIDVTDTEIDVRVDPPRGPAARERCRGVRGAARRRDPLGGGYSRR